MNNILSESFGLVKGGKFDVRKRRREGGGKRVTTKMRLGKLAPHPFGFLTLKVKYQHPLKG